MSTKFRHHFPKSFSLLVLFLLALVGLQGCFRGGWHSGDRVERMEKRIDWIQEEVAEDLEIRPHQEQAYQALVNRHRELLVAWAKRMKATSEDLHAAIGSETPDPQEIGALLKRFLREKPADADVEALIDETVAFYNTLEPDQKEIVREKLKRHYRWHH